MSNLKLKKELRRYGIAIVDALNYAIIARKNDDKIAYKRWNDEANRLIKKRNGISNELWGNTNR
jgi:hypothetical protein